MIPLKSKALLQRLASELAWQQTETSSTSLGALTPSSPLVRNQRLVIALSFVLRASFCGPSHHRQHSEATTLLPSVHVVLACWCFLEPDLYFQLLCFPTT
jgi:hypothetical protein